MTVGTTVKHSGYSLEPKRLYWLGLGDYTRKNAAKAAYEAACEERGTITEVIEPSGGFNRATCATYQVQWASGRVSQCMPYMVEAAV